MKIMIISSFLSASLMASTVFIHGANFDKNSWEALRSNLSEKTYAFNLPGRASDGVKPKEVTLELSAKSLCEQLRPLEAPYTLIAHSQGGAIVNQAVGTCPELNIEKIIYISAVVPFPGEGVFEKLSKADEKNYFRGITYNSVEGLLEISDASEFVKSFSGDVSETLKEMIIKYAVSEPSKVGEGKLSFKLSDLKKAKLYYIHSAKDLIVSLPSQKIYTKRLKFEKSFGLNSHHLPMVTHVGKLANILEQILEE